MSSSGPGVHLAGLEWELELRYGYRTVGALAIDPVTLKRDCRHFPSDYLLAVGGLWKLQRRYRRLIGITYWLRC